MLSKRDRFGILLGSLCLTLLGCGNTSGGGSGSSGAGAAGSAGQSAGAGGNGTQGGAANAGSSSGGGSALAGGDSGGLGSAAEAGAPEAGSGAGGSAGSGAGGSAGSSAGASSSGGGAAGSGGGSAGAGGSGGLQATSNKLDVLMVIDNSVSMADKQGVLEATLPAFLKRLTNPLCVDGTGKPVAIQPSSISQACSTGAREFTANDIHLGVISTSLGAHGGTVCATSLAATDTLDDKGELIGKLRPGLTTWQNSGFLSWDPSGVSGSSDAAGLTAALTAIVVADGDHGCGYEAPLEAMYRFLIDPEPPATVVKNVSNVTERQGIDNELLSERAAFLRPDSAVAILTVSDENDCSIQDDGVGWYVSSSAHMPASTAACAGNPNDVCCRSCIQNESAPPNGCAALSAEPACQQNGGLLAAADDSLNLRCFDQKRRFGFDLLYPTSRYSAGLTDLAVKNNAGMLVKNPLFFDKNGVQTRSPSLVSLAVMVGVPWQDLATTASLTGKLQYLDAAGLATQNRWSMFLGDPKNYVAALDPLMVESEVPRTGVQPITGVALAPATSQDPTKNPINGHEQNIVSKDDLEYACIFKLPTPKVCASGDSACDCSPDKNADASIVTANNSPVCQPPTGGPAGTTQYYAKAYPGLRELEVVHQLTYRGVPTSICTKTMADVTDPDFGYGPAFDALLKRVGATLRP